MTETTDPTFYRTPGDAIVAAPERWPMWPSTTHEGGAGRDRGAGLRSRVPGLREGGGLGGHADRRQRAASLRVECMLERAVPWRARRATRTPVSRRARPALVADLHPRYQTRTALIMLYATRHKDTSCPSHLLGQPTANTATGTGSSANEPGSSRLPGRPVAESAAPAGHGGVLRRDVPVLRRHSPAVTAWSGREADVRAFGSWPKSPVAAAVPCADVARPGRSGPCTEFQTPQLEGT
jgi:hypothetical protein